MSDNAPTLVPGFDVRPYQGVGALEFGMSRAATENAVGSPVRSGVNRLGETSLSFSSISTIFADDKLVEIGLLPESNATISGLAAFSNPNAFERLLELDGDPKETLGFIVLFNLGITLTGFHDEDESQLAMAAFCRGRWDALKSEMKDFA